MPKPDSRPDGDDEPAGQWHHYRPAFTMPYHVRIAEPTPEYLEWVINELESRGWRVVIKDSRPTITPVRSDPIAIPGRLLTSVKDHKPAILQHMAKTRGLDLSTLPPPMPEPETVVEWCDIDHMTSDPGGLCLAEELSLRPWWRWRYRNANRWYAVNGDTWEEG